MSLISNAAEKFKKDIIDTELSDQELKEIQERAERAMPGPWEVVGNTVTIEEGLWFALPGAISTAEFIAHARTDVERLLRYALSLERLIQGPPYKGHQEVSDG